MALTRRWSQTLGLEGLEPFMLRTVADQPSLWEAILPEELRRLPEELARLDSLLDDPVFFAPFVPFFDLRLGRPSTPMETYLRLMFSSSATGSGTSRCVGRCRTRSPGDSSAGSGSTSRCRTRPR